MPNAGNVVVTITARDATSKATKSAQTRFQQLGSTIQQTGLGQIAAFGGISLAIRKSLGDYADFDKRVREIGTLLSDFNENTLQTLGDDIKQMSVQFGQSIDAMAKARYDAISAGFTDIAESSQLLGVASKLAVGGVSEVSRTTDVLTSVLNSYQLRADQAQKVSDLLFTTVRLGKTTIDQLASGMGKAAAIAPTVGVSFEELSAAVATLTAGGQSTDETVTALGATMTALLSPSEALGKRLKELGFESGTAAVKTLGLAETLKRIVDGASEADQAAYFPNVRAMRSVFPLTGTLMEKFNDNLAEMQNAAGATDTAFGKMSEGVAFRFSQMKARIETASIEIGAALLPIGEAAAGIIEAFSSLSASTIQNFAKIGVSIAGALIGIKVLTVAIGVLGVTMGPAGLLLTGLGIAVGLFTALGGVSSDAGNQVTTAAIAMGKFSDSVDDLNTSLDETPGKIRDVKDELNSLSVTQLESRLAELEQKKLDISLSFLPPPAPDIELPTFEPQPVNFEFGFETTQLDAVNQAINLTGENFVSAATKIDEEIGAITQRLTELKSAAEDVSTTSATITLTENEKKAIEEVETFRRETTQEMLLNLVESEVEAREKAKEEALRIEQEKIAETTRINIESQQQYLALRGEILLTDKEREIQVLADKLSAWNANWAELEAGQQLFTEGLKQINARYLTEEQIQWETFSNSVGATLTNAIGTKVVSGLDNVFGYFIAKQTTDFGKFAAGLVKIFAQAVARMIIEIESAKLAQKLLGGLGLGFLGPLGAVLGLAGLFLEEGGIVTGENAIDKPMVVFTPRRNDKVPALLSVGEAVIPAQAVTNNREIVEMMIRQPGKISAADIIQSQFISGDLSQYFQTGGISERQTETGRIEQNNSLEVYRSSSASATDSFPVIFEPRGRDVVPTFLSLGDAIIPPESVRENPDIINRLTSSTSKISLPELIGNKTAPVNYFNSGDIISKSFPVSYMSDGGILNKSFSPSYFSGGGIIHSEFTSNRPAPVSYFQTGGIAGSEIIQQRVEPIVINGSGTKTGEAGSAKGDTVIINNVFQINAIDSAGVAEFVQGREFRLAISETINNSLLNLKAGVNRVEAIY